MPIYDIEVPGKGTFRVESPTELSDQQAYAAVMDQVDVAKPQERTWGEAATDVGASLTSGIGQLAQMPGQIGTLAGFYKPEESGTGLQGIGRELEQAGQGMKSEALKAKEAARAQKVGQAEGVVDEFWTAIKETATDPALMTSFFAEQVPNLIGSMGAGMLTRGAVKIAMREATEAALQKSAVAGMVGGGAIMQGADVGADTFENLYDKLIKDGATPERAAEIALEKGRTAAIEAAGISVATAFLPGGTTVEQALVGRGLPRAGGIAKGFLGEAAQEGIEEGGGQVAANIQEQSLYPETDIFKGVGEAAGMGALMGGAFGGVGGVSLRAPTQPGIPTEVTQPTEATPTSAEGPSIKQLEEEAPPIGVYPTEETPPTEQPPVAEQPPVEQPPVEPPAPPVVEQPPVEQPPVSEAPPPLPPVTEVPLETLHPIEQAYATGNVELANQVAAKARENGVVYSFTPEERIDINQSKIDWDKLRGLRTGEKFINFISEYVPLDTRQILERIVPYVKDIPIGFNAADVNNPKSKWYGTAGVHQRYGTGKDTRHKIQLFTKSDNGNTFETVSHELIHGATTRNYAEGMRYIHNNGRIGDQQFSQAAQELNELAGYLLDNYEQDIGFVKFYKQPGQSRATLQDSFARELLTWGTTNRETQEALKKIKLPNGQSVWSKFVETMRKLLNIPAEETNALTRILDLQDKLIGGEPSKPYTGTKRTRKPGKIERFEAEEQPIEDASMSQRQTVSGRAITDPIWTIEPINQKSFWAKFVDDKVYQYVDKFVDLKKIIEAINKTTKKLDATWDAYMKETLYHNRVAYQTNEFLKNELKPLAQEMVARGVSEEELNNYLLARHAEEYNNAINERNDRTDLQHRGSGVHTMIARAYLNNASPKEVSNIRKILTENPDPKNNIVFNENEEALLKDLSKMTEGKRRAMEQLAKRIDSMVKETQDIAVKGGIERDKTIEYWRDKYPHYVPLKRTPEELDFVETSTGMGRGFSARAGFGKAATGSLKGVDNILSNLILQRDMAIVKAEKARIGRALYAMSLSHPNPNFWLPVNPNAAVISKANDLLVEIMRDKRRLDAVTQKIDNDIANGKKADAEDMQIQQELREKIRRDNIKHEQLAAEGEKVKQKIVDELVAMGLNPEEVNNLIREPQGAWYNPKTKQVEYRTNNYLRASQNVLAIPVDGETRYIFFNPGDERAKRLVTSLRGADVEDLGQITAMVAKFTRWIASVNTQYNPFFGIVNMMRDIQGAQFNMSSTPLAGRQMAVNKNIYGAAKTIYQSLRSGKPTGEFAQDWLEFQSRGGPTGIKDMLVDQKKNESVLQKELENLRRNPTDAALRNGFKAAVSWMSDFNDTMENAVRLSAFIEAKKKFGKTMNADTAADKAAELAKNLTVNFNRKGAKTQFVNSLYAFFNASVQGSARLYETLKSPAGKKIMASLVTLGAIQQLILSASFDDDDPPEFVRQKNLIIPTSDGKYLSFPMPLGFNLFVNMGRIGTSAFQSGGKNIAKDIGKMLTVASESVNPMGGGSLVQAAAPTVLDPAVALYGNVDAFGRPIYREDRPGKPVPGYLRSTEGSSAVSKFIAQALNRMSGGTEFQKGQISPTADEIDYIAGQLGGGTYREARKVVEAAASVGTGEEVAPYRRPLVGRFTGDTGSEANVRNKFYEHINTIAGYEEEIKGRAKKGQDVGEFIQSHPDAALYKVADQVYNQISELNQTRKKMVEYGATKEQLKQINDAKIQRMRQFNELYDQMLKK